MIYCLGKTKKSVLRFHQAARRAWSITFGFPCGAGKIFGAERLFGFPQFLFFGGVLLSALKIIFTMRI